MNCRRLVVLITLLTVLIGPHYSMPAGATETLVSGSCLFDVDVTLIGNTLSVDAVGLGTCVTTDGFADGSFDADIPGDVGFDCESGLIVGAGGSGTGGFGISVEGSTRLGVSGMSVAGASDGTTLGVAFTWKVANRVVAGQGVFSLVDTSSPCSSVSPTTSWTGAIIFVDPDVSQ